MALQLCSHLNSIGSGQCYFALFVRHCQSFVFIFDELTYLSGIGSIFEQCIALGYCISTLFTAQHSVWWHFQNFCVLNWNFRFRRTSLLSRITSSPLQSPEIEPLDIIGIRLYSWVMPFWKPTTSVGAPMRNSGFWNWWIDSLLWAESKISSQAHRQKGCVGCVCTMHSPYK